ncbi:MAG: glycoside hydrolase family 3 C-terminal domain-containing protein, partial [Eubacteriales bacterium]|nr:glycoside hydrolase family 3 C-terminal domain-containing protein [Eubacteriales bacterium]
LLSQMTSEDKAAQMLHVTLVTLKESWFNELDIGFALAYTYLADGAEAAAQNTNEIQALAETSRLGIPVVFSMDSVIGASWVDGATVLPDQITLAATGDADIVRELAKIQNEEMRAIGVRMSLSPVADLATDPRWGRVQECFGEDADTATAMVVAAIEGLQGGAELTKDSVMACVKHFPGSGSQTAGVDGTPLVYNDDTFPVALSIFRAAIDAGAACIMPYGYSTVPYLGGDAVDNYAHESSTVMTELLRGELGYTGIIQTDWGLSPTAAAVAGADVLGGASQREISKIVDALSEEQLNEKVGKLLVAKFKLGVFENPYADVDNAVRVLSDPTHKDAVKEAAAQALTLVKYENVAPLSDRELIVAGSLATDGHALSSGWTVENYQAKNILTALQEKAGAQNVTYIGDDISQVKASYPEGTTAIAVIGEASGTHEPEWGTSTLVFPDTQTDMVKALQDAGVTVVTVVLMNRPYVLSDMVANSDAVLLAYRPGMTAGADAVAEALFGEHAITGRTPFQIPASMDQVLAQREDVAKDIVDPLFDYGYGIDVEAFGQ